MNVFPIGKLTNIMLEYCKTSEIKVIKELPNIEKLGQYLNVNLNEFEKHVNEADFVIFDFIHEIATNQFLKDSISLENLKKQITNIKKIVKSQKLILLEFYLPVEFKNENGNSGKVINYDSIVNINYRLEKVYEYFKNECLEINSVNIKLFASTEQGINVSKLDQDVPGEYLTSLFSYLYNTFDNTQELHKVPFSTFCYLFQNSNINFEFAAGGEARIATFKEEEEKTLLFWSDFFDSLLKVNRRVLPILKPNAEYILDLDIEKSDLEFAIVVNFFNEREQVFNTQKITSQEKIIKTPKKFNFYRIYLRIKGKGEAQINYLRIMRYRRQGYVTAFDKTKINQNSESIKYLFTPNKSKYLVVAFHGFNPNVTKYEFLGVLKNVPVNKLFLLDDYGLNGRFYQDKDRKDNLQQNIISLINDIATKCGVKKEHIIMLGGSKGGGAALYFGLRMNVGHIIAGGPPIYWSIFNSPYYHQSSFVKNVAGGLSEDDSEYMDSILPSILHDNINTKIEFLSITNDIYYVGYFERFTKLLHENKIEYNNVLKIGNGHGDLPKFLGNWAKETLLNILN